MSGRREEEKHRKREIAISQEEVADAGNSSHVHICYHLEVTHVEVSIKRTGNYKISG
jgi:hypothetical protein